MKRLYRIWLIIVLQVTTQLPVVFAQNSTENIDQSNYITYTTVQPAAVPVAPVPQEPEQSTFGIPVAEATSAPIAPRPTNVNLPMQFYSQAPFGDWGDPYQNACEEMSVLLTHAFLTGRTYTAEEIDAAVVRLTEFVANSGYEESMPLAAVQSIAHDYFNARSFIIENPSVADIEKSIQAGYPVIAPLAGRNLNNPYFTGEGPWYHMLVISGYNETEFITQEVGINSGANYAYKKTTIMQNLHDYTGVDEYIKTGERRVLVLIP